MGAAGIRAPLLGARSAERRRKSCACKPSQPSANLTVGSKNSAVARRFLSVFGVGGWGWGGEGGYSPSGPPF